jgi:hypothetical protein
MMTALGFLISVVCAFAKLGGALHWTWWAVGAPFMLAALIEAQCRGDILGWLVADDYLDDLSSSDFNDD